MKWKRFHIDWHSIRFQLVIGVAAILLPFCAYAIYNNVYAIYVVRKQVTDSNKKLITLYMQEIDNRLNNVEIFLADMITSDPTVFNMQILADESERNMDKASIYNSLSNDIPQYSFVDCFFVYSANYNDFVSVYNPGSTDYITRNNVKNYICNLVDNDSNHVVTQSYFSVKINNKYYIMRIMRNGNVYIGLWISVDNMDLPLSLINKGKTGKAFFVDTKGQAMNNENFVNQNQIKLNGDYTNYYISGGKNKFLVVGQNSSEGDFSLIVLIPDKQILGSLFYLRYIVIIMMIITFFIILSFFVFLRRIVLYPFGRVVKVMNQVQVGNLDARISPFRTSTEFRIISDTFNNMMGKINELKISVYEEQIGKQKEELEHLQLQMKPHFILNTLNIIYSLAQIKNYKLIQELTLCLSEYFNFISRKMNTFVRLDEEIRFTKNYIRIQELRFSNLFSSAIEVPDDLMDVLVPPLILQTFVENTIKYAFTIDQPLCLSIRITHEKPESGDGIRISIRNTGNWFDENILKQLRAGKRIIDEKGEHIGIWNIQRRLELLYGEKARITFQNIQPKGVATEIILPIQR